MTTPTLTPEVVPVSTNEQLATALRHLKDGAGSDELFFDCGTGLLSVVAPGQNSPDARPATAIAEEGFFSEPPKPAASNAELAEALRQVRAKDEETELHFDPATGLLRVGTRGEATSADQRPATEMAAEGFFAPRVAVLFADDLAAWLTGDGTHANAVTFERDDDVLQHALVPPADWRRVGTPAPALTVRDDSLALSPEGLLARAGSRSEVRHLVAVSSSGPRARSWTLGPEGWAENALQLVPTTAVFSRNEGLLESSLLAERKVAIVGLGSGGATIARELAKAGVGRFLLADRDRLEVHNVGRHLCDLTDLGRLKTRAVRDRVLATNPGARVDLLEGDVLADPDAFAEAVADCDVLVGATDNNASRRLVNRVAIETGKPAIFGRAFTRACGGDVIRVRPGGPCYACLVDAAGGQRAVPRGGAVPAYADRPVAVEPGLALDIAPIAHLCAKLVVQELVRGTGSTLEALNGELDAPLFIWANRREAQFAHYAPMGASVSDMTVMRWYGARAPRRSGCLACDGDAQLAAMEAELAAARATVEGRGA